MNIKKILKTISLNLLIIIALPIGTVTEISAEDFTVDVQGYPYEQTFIISAYYSPLPCQNKYVTGSYNGDIRLNGGGVHGADGSDVYPGMIAAPKTYPFGMKLYIPDVGIVAVHDRGGAIVTANVRNNAHDRLDIWMGYGDKGLKRALNWGKRTVNATLYGINDSILEEVYFDGYSSDEAVPNECDYADANQSTPSDTTVVTTTNNEPVKSNLEVIASEFDIELSDSLGFELVLGSEGERVKNLQTELSKLNYYKGEINGIYDSVLAHAVFKFQQAQGIVQNETDFGAGVFGPKTSSKMNQIISKRNSTKVMIAYTTQKMQKTSLYAEKANLIAMELDEGISHPAVKSLQAFLKAKGYFDNDYLTDFYGTKTKEAVLKFQLDNKLIDSETDTGAGRVGPSTLKLINSLI
ncbi:MAG: peptidoglycan-binding protein [Candidatus Gracilibacteria bacterium]|jgi:peptidoglycan hydrolase-like protein with peptidoglycan-binding domain/3D (Asp-Asp-Asp) domain-containing protein